MNNILSKSGPSSREKFTYANVRFERLVKLARDTVEQFNENAREETAQFLRVFRLYADLLAQILLDGKYSRIAERRLIEKLQKNGLADGQIQRRIEWLATNFHNDWNDRTAVARRVENKRGAISFGKRTMEKWRDWLITQSVEPVDFIISILSRGLTDASLASRIYGIPTRYICFSRKRLKTQSAVILDSDLVKPETGKRVLLIDSHAKTGETIRECLTALEGQNSLVSGIQITENEMSSSCLPSDFKEIPSDESGVERWTAWSRPEISPYMVNSAPLIVLCGYPGSGKTLIRKAIGERTGWPAFSWSKTVRKLLVDEFDGNSIEGVRSLTVEERNDPEFVAREFFLKERLDTVAETIPIVVDGLKSLSGLRFLIRHLKRTAVVVEVSRSLDARKAAIAERSDFDYPADEEVSDILDEIGLSALLENAVYRIDTSDSNVDRRTGLIALSANTELAVESLFGEIANRTFSPSIKSVTAAFLLLTPDENKFLLLRGASSERWGLAGGHVERGEGLWEAAVRELYEETGLKNPAIIAVCQPFTMTRDLRQGEITLREKKTTIFAARARSRRITLSNEHSDSRWVTADEAYQLLPAPINVLPKRVLDLLQIIKDKKE